MTETQALTISEGSEDALFSMALWGEAEAVQGRLAISLPSPCRAAAIGEDRIIWWEPQGWLVRSSRSPRASLLKRLNDAAAGDGAVTEVSGAFRRIRLQGPGWRELLMIGGVFDAETPAFGPGATVGTVIHHLSVRLDVIDAQTVDAYTPSSFAPELLSHWRRGAARTGKA